jgi:hypothetical protein
VTPLSSDLWFSENQNRQAKMRDSHSHWFESDDFVKSVILDGRVEGLETIMHSGGNSQALQSYVDEHSARMPSIGNWQMPFHQMASPTIYVPDPSGTHLSSIIVFVLKGIKFVRLTQCPLIIFCFTFARLFLVHIRPSSAVVFHICLFAPWFAMMQ